MAGAGLRVRAGPGRRALRWSCLRTDGRGLHPRRRRSLEVGLVRPMVAVRATGTGTAPQLEVFATSGDERRLAAATRGASGWWLGRDRLGRRRGRLPALGGRHADLHSLLRSRATLRRLGAADRTALAPGRRLDANQPANLHGRAATGAIAARRLSDTLDEQLRDELATGFAADGPGELLEGSCAMGALLWSRRRRQRRPGRRRLLGSGCRPRRCSRSRRSTLTSRACSGWCCTIRSRSTGSYDYKVVAHHDDVRYPSRLVRFDDAPVGPLGTGTFVRDGVTLARKQLLALRFSRRASDRVQRCAWRRRAWDGRRAATLSACARRNAAAAGSPGVAAGRVARGHAGGFRGRVSRRRHAGGLGSASMR